MRGSFAELESEFAMHGNPKSQQALERDQFEWEQRRFVGCSRFLAGRAIERKNRIPLFLIAL
jgi:hypothetical protein